MWESEKQEKKGFEFSESQKYQLSVLATVNIEVIKKTDALLSRVISDLQRKIDKKGKKAAA